MGEPEILKIREDGTAVGELEDVLYLGTPKQVGWDELTITCTLDGESLTRVDSYGDKVVGNSRLTESAYKANFDDQEMAAAAWDAEVNLSAYGKSYINAIGPEGNIVQVEQKLTVYDWTAV